MILFTSDVALEYGPAMVGTHGALDAVSATAFQTSQKQDWPLLVMSSCTIRHSMKLSHLRRVFSYGVQKRLATTQSLFSRQGQDEPAYSLHHCAG